MLYWASIALCTFVSAAVAGGFLSGALSTAAVDFGRQLPQAAADLHRSLPSHWSRWPLRAAKYPLTAFLFVGLVTLTFAGYVLVFLATSPLYAAYFFNAVAGRPAPCGRLVQWYATWPARWRAFRAGRRCAPPR